MTMKESFDIVYREILRYITERFTGQVVFIFNFRRGGIGSLSLRVDRITVSNEKRREIQSIETNYLKS